MLRYALPLLLLLPVGALAQATCNADNPTQTSCKFLPPTDGRYIIKAVATSVDGNNGPWMETTIAIQGAVCQSQRNSWQDGVLVQAVMCEVQFQANVPYSIVGSAKNHHARGAGVVVTVEQKTLWGQ